VTGSREFDDYKMLQTKLYNLLSPRSNHITIISGGDEGADKLGEKFAIDYGTDLLIMPADWETRGKYAVYERNIDMALTAIKDASVYKTNIMLVIFWDGKSIDTRNMISIAMYMGIETHVFFFQGRD